MIWYVMFAQMTPKMMADCHSFHMAEGYHGEAGRHDESPIERISRFSN